MNGYILFLLGVHSTAEVGKKGVKVVKGRKIEKSCTLKERRDILKKGRAVEEGRKVRRGIGISCRGRVERRNNLYERDESDGQIASQGSNKKVKV